MLDEQPTVADQADSAPPELSALAARVATARGKLPLQADPALLAELSDREIAAERELAEWIRAQRRRQRKRAVSAELSTQRRDRRVARALRRADEADTRWHRRARAARMRVSNPDARMAQLFRRAEWSSRALIGVVVLGMLWAGVNVQHNLVPSGDMADPLYWLSYGFEAMISIPIITIMVVATTAARWGRDIDRGKVVFLEAALLGVTIALNAGPHLVAGEPARAAEAAVAPVMVGVVIWLHAWVSARYAQLIDDIPGSGLPHSDIGRSEHDRDDLPAPHFREAYREYPLAPEPQSRTHSDRFPAASTYPQLSQGEWPADPGGNDDPALAPNDAPQVAASPTGDAAPTNTATTGTDAQPATSHPDHSRNPEPASAAQPPHHSDTRGTNLRIVTDQHRRSPTRQAVDDAVQLVLGEPAAEAHPDRTRSAEPTDSHDHHLATASEASEQEADPTDMDTEDVAPTEIDPDEVDARMIAREIRARGMSKLSVDQLTEILTLTDESWTPAAIGAAVGLPGSKVLGILETARRISLPMVVGG